MTRANTPELAINWVLLKNKWTLYLKSTNYRLSRQGYSGRKSASELLRRLREAPAGRAGWTEVRARRATVLGLVGTLKALVVQIKRLEDEIAQAVRAHPDGEVFLSLFRSPKSTLTAACLLAEIGDQRERYPTQDAMAADAGMSPITIQSGRRKVASFRRACDKRLRKAVATLAESTRHHNPWAEDVYLRARGRARTRYPYLGAWLDKDNLQDVAGQDALRSGQARQPKTPPSG